MNLYFLYGCDSKYSLFKAEEEEDSKGQVRVLMENEKYKKLGEKAITVIELAETMVEILDQAI